MRKLTKKSSTMIPLLASVLTLLTAQGVVHADFADDAKDGITPVDNGSTTANANGLLQTIVNTLLFLVGAVSVIMIIVGGIRFVISRGDQNAAASARNTVMYAVVGLIVAVTAYGLVNYVLGKLY